MPWTCEYGAEFASIGRIYLGGQMVGTLKRDDTTDESTLCEAVFWWQQKDFS